MADRQMVSVPNFVGEPVHIARDVAAKVGLGLASGDPDGPGIGSRTWPGVFWVIDQDPSAGSLLEQGSQVQVTFVEDGQAKDNIPSQNGGPTPPLVSHADPKNEPSEDM